jgi:Stage II sporulation protein E (SpoIIE)
VLAFLGSGWFEQGRLAACNPSPARAFTKSADTRLEIVSVGVSAKKPKGEKLSSEPQVLFEDLNRVISELIAAKMFVTLAFVSLAKSNDLHFATAGHLPILHFRSATGSVCELDSKGRSSRVLTWNYQVAISRFS